MAKPMIKAASAYPFITKKPFVHKKFGDERHDPWHWIKDKKNKEVLDYLRKENKLFSDSMKPFEALRKKIYETIKSRILEDDVSYPMKCGSYEYYTKSQKEKQYEVFCRKKIGSSSEEILMDVNSLAEGKDFYDVGFCDTSPDHSLMVHAIDDEGEENYKIIVEKIGDPSWKKDTIEHCSTCLEWTNDNKGFYYVKLDEHHMPRQVYYHLLHEDSKKDKLIYEEKDEGFILALTKSEDESYIFIASHGNDMSQWFAIKADRFSDQVVLIRKKSEEVEYEVSYFNGSFILLTNENAPHYKLIKLPVGDLNQQHPEELIAHDDQTILEDFAIYPHHIVVLKRKNQIPFIDILDLSGNLVKQISYPDGCYELDLLERGDFETDEILYGYSSLKTPYHIYSYHLKDGSTKLCKKQAIPDKNFNEEDYTCKTEWIKSHDGVMVPVSLLYKKGIELDGSHPLFLSAYGSYGHSSECHFRVSATCLVDMGFVYGIAHVRGGMELGRSWYTSGKMLQKKNTFEDFIACGKELSKKGYTSLKKIVISGGSAGGLLIGACLNEAPEIFAGAIADVPFVDVLTTMLDDTLPLTIGEYTEWGNPNTEEHYRYMKSYSPVDNVSSKPYPPVLVVSGLHDFRVTFWEHIKWINKMREHTTQKDNPIFLKTDLSSGHSGASGRYDQLDDLAFEICFAVQTVNL